MLTIVEQSRRLATHLESADRSALERAIKRSPINSLTSLFDAIVDGPKSEALWLTWLIPRLRGFPEKLQAMLLYRIMAVDADDVVTAEAIRGLALLSVEEVIPELARRLISEESSLDIRIASAYALGHSDSPKALPVLIRVLEDTQQQAAVRGMAAEGIGLLGEGSKTALRALMAALQDRSNEIVYWAAFALSSMRATTALPALLAAQSRTSDPVTVAEIAHSIAHLTDASEDS